MKRAIAHYLAYVGAATLLALAYWAGAETVAPGQQYADPWLPCLYIGSIGGPFLWLAVAYAAVVREYVSSRRHAGNGPRIAVTGRTAPAEWSANHDGSEGHSGAQEGER